MKVGFIGFGEVSYRLSNILLHGKVEVFTSLEGRSDKTKKLAYSSEVVILDTFKEVAKESDILVSANSPNSALAIAIKYGSLTDGLFLDLNNVSSNTTEKIANFLSEDHFIDAALMGGVKSDKLNLFVSGKLSYRIAELIGKLPASEDYKINVKIVSDKIGDVSKLKMLRSYYTKGVSALLIETFETAKSLGLDEDLWRVLSLTEGENFEKYSKSRIINSYKSSKRKYEEVEEILEFLDELNIDDSEDFDDRIMMCIATKNKFEYLKDKN